MSNDKILYVSDLDGTLLKNNQKISSFTAKTINMLVQNGMNFTFASQRSPISISEAIAGISPQLPMVVYNGAFIFDPKNNKRLSFKHFSSQEVKETLDMMFALDVYPLVYKFINDREAVSYISDHQTDGVKAILKRRGVDFRNFPTDRDGIYNGDVFFFACIDVEEKILPLYRLLKNKFECIYSVDLYCGAQRLDVFPKDVTKANSILELKKCLRCDKIICFGDAENDISIFKIADQSYAVDNAINELKKLATGVIGSNMDDGVAKWLLQNFN